MKGKVKIESEKIVPEEKLDKDALSIIKDDKGYNLVKVSYNDDGKCKTLILRTDYNYSVILEQFKIEVIRLFNPK